MKKYLFVLAVFFVSFASAEPLKVRVSAKSAILMNAETGAILYEKNAHEPRYPASITKIATLLYAIRQNGGALEGLVACPYHCLKRISSTVKEAHGYRDPAYWLEPDGTHFWIKQGEKIPFRDLLYGMMLVSGNDASNYIAHHVGGSIPKFMTAMNDYLKKIGCNETCFKNPHGLHHPKHITTAYDMALITREALKENLVRKIVSTTEYERSETNLQKPMKIRHSNQLLHPGKFFYHRAIGIKTGYTSKARHNLVCAAKERKRTLIAALLGAEDSSQNYRDAIRLFETAFNEEEVERLLFKRDENIFMREVKKAKRPLRASLLEDVSIRYFPSEEPKIRIELNWEELSLPIKEGSWVGEMHILDENYRILEKAPLYAKNDVQMKTLLAFVEGLNAGTLDLSPLRNVLVTLLLLSMLLSLYFIYSIRL